MMAYIPAPPTIMASREVNAMLDENEGNNKSLCRAPSSDLRCVWHTNPTYCRCTFYQKSCCMNCVTKKRAR